MAGVRCTAEAESRFMALDLDPTRSIPDGEAMSGGECMPLAKNPFMYIFVYYMHIR